MATSRLYIDGRKPAVEMSDSNHESVLSASVLDRHCRLTAGAGPGGSSNTPALSLLGQTAQVRSTFIVADVSCVTLSAVFFTGLLQASPASGKSESFQSGSTAVAVHRSSVSNDSFSSNELIQPAFSRLLACVPTSGSAAFSVT